jgi:hypothetical protein
MYARSEGPTFHANNISLTPDIALSESSASFTYYNFVPSDGRPRLIVAISARFSRVVNLVKPGGMPPR